MEASQQVREKSEQGEEMSLKAIILKLLEWGKFVWKKKFIIIFVGTLGAAFGFTYAYLRDPKYEAELTFVMEDNSSNPLGALLGVGGQLGLDLGSSGSSGIFQGDNIMLFLKSRVMLEKTLLTPIEVGGKKISLLEDYLRFNKIRDSWKTPALKDLRFPINQDRESFTLVQDSILKMVCDQIIKTDLEVDKKAKQYNFISITCTTYDEQFSKVFTERLMNEAINFYVDMKTKKIKQNVDRLQGQADSLEMELNKKTYSVARTQDINMNPAKQIAGVGLEVANRDKLVLQTMYGEVVKNLELTKIAMAQETPIIQIVDTPLLPLKKLKLGKLVGLVLGGFMGGLFAMMFLIARKIYTDIMNS